MKLGINNGVNTGTKKSGLQHMAGGKSKINPPNSHPSNPIHKAVTEESKPVAPAAPALPSDMGIGCGTPGEPLESLRFRDIYVKCWFWITEHQII